MYFPLFLIWTIFSCKVHVLVIISLLLSQDLMIFSNILKDLFNLHFEEKFETEFELYICNVGDFKDPLKQDLALEFCGNQNKGFSILTETHINHYLILQNKK